jgi:hypothetical protein
LFCKAFNAENKARSDLSVDAKLNRLGFGLKTFLAKGNTSYEKVAEFNKDASTFSEESGKALAVAVSELRNERMLVSRRILGTERDLYHCVVRRDNRMLLCEHDYEEIDVSRITVDSCNDKVIYFNDERSDYKFMKSKSTLFKSFCTSSPIHEFEVDIIEDPLSVLISKLSPKLVDDALRDNLHLPVTRKSIDTLDYVFLPLYSVRNNDVCTASGLNEWNAKGRERHEDEVYIPIPRIIHNVFPRFFPDRDTNFALNLPNGDSLTAKVCQQGGKALMSNPNKDLGKWILRDVLKLAPDTLVTMKDLKRLGIDSVLIRKLDSHVYSIDFARYGAYIEFHASISIL